MTYYVELVQRIRETYASDLDRPMVAAAADAIETLINERNEALADWASLMEIFLVLRLRRDPCFIKCMTMPTRWIRNNSATGFVV